MSQDTTYNGWTNYETWAVSLWLDNEEHTYHYYRDLTRRIYRAARPRYDWETKKDRAISDLAEALKDDHEENRPDFPTSVYSDLLGAALSSVNWREIAEHYIDDLDDDDKTDEDTDDETEDDAE